MFSCYRYGEKDKPLKGALKAPILPLSSAKQVPPAVLQEGQFTHLGMLLRRCGLSMIDRPDFTCASS